MKKKIFPVAAFLLIPAILMAQKESPVEKKDIPEMKNPAVEHGQLMTFRQMDQRKIYHWGNGQRSTPTGRQAGEVTPKYVLVMGDSAVVVWHPFKKPDIAKNK